MAGGSRIKLLRKKLALGCAQNDLVHHRRYEMREQAKCEITEHIEILYNRQRRFATVLLAATGSVTLQLMVPNIADRPQLSEYDEEPTR